MVMKVKISGPQLETTIIKPTITRNDVNDPSTGDFEITEIISSDANNGLTLGTDNKLYVTVSGTDVTLNTDLAGYLQTLVNG